ncbi:MAG: SPOR domain-containing protein [Sphingomonas sp.]
MATSGENVLRDEDRLPWLETVDDDYREGPSLVRTALFVLAGLAAVAALVWLAYSFMGRGRPSGGSGELIAAQEGDYKVKPDNPGGMKVEGEGDTAFATSEGKGSGNGAIDLKATPEAPVAGTLANRTTGAKNAGNAIPPSSGKLAAPPAPGVRALAVPGAASGGSLVQLGAFPSEGAANVAWAAASRRFAYLAPLGKQVQQADVNGRKVFRLRVNAGSNGQAAELCGKLKVAGEACFISAN